MCGIRCQIGLGLLLLSIVYALTSQGWTFGAGKYSGYKVLRIHPSTKRDAQDLIKRVPSHLQDVLHMRRRRASSMDIMVSPSELEDLLELIELLQIPHETLVDDLRVALDDHVNDVMDNPDNEPFSLHRYNTLEEIYQWLRTQAQTNPHMVDFFQIGKSWEKRPLNVVRLQAPSGYYHGKTKPAIWMDAGIHSNEWIGPATLLYYINEIVSKYNQDPEVTSLLDDYDIYILPVFNVDGYSYTWTQDRLWRKSRSTRNGTCAGVDMNRNWPYKWGLKPGTSSDPCSVIYGGMSPESEPEVQAVVQFLQDHRKVIKAYIAFHSYSQLWMMPYSFSHEKPQDFPELVNISEQVAEAISQKNGKEYNYGSVVDLLGEASGSSVDFTYGQLGIKYSFGVELRDDGLFGSLLPPAQIVPTAVESFEGIKKLADLIKDNVTV